MSLRTHARLPTFLLIALAVAVLIVPASGGMANSVTKLAPLPSERGVASAHDAAERGNRPATSPPRAMLPSSVNPGYVFDTVVPWNTSVVSGNFLAVGSPDPQEAVFDPANGYLFVISYNDAVVVWEPTTDQFVKSIPLTDYATDLVFDSIDNKLFVLTEEGLNVTIIDTTTLTVLGAVTVGSNPYGEVWDPQDDDVYVSNLGGTNVSIIDAATDASVGQFTVGSTPEAMGYDPSANDILVGDSGVNGVEVYNVSQGIVTSALTTYGTASAITMDNTAHLLIMAAGSGTIYVLGAGTMTLIRTFVPASSPEWLNVSSSGHVYAVDEYTDQVTIFDAANLAASDVNLTVGDTPIGAAYDPATGDEYVTNEDSGNVSIISDSSLTLTGTDELSFTPTAIAYDAAHQVYYVAASTPSLLLVNATTHVAMGTVDLPIDPVDLLDVPSLNELWISGNAPGFVGWVDVLDESTLTIVLRHFTQGTGPMAFDPTEDVVCLANAKGNVTLLDPATDHQTASIPLPLFQSIYWVSGAGIVFDAANDDLYITDGSLNDTVTVVNVGSQTPVHWITVGGWPDGIVLDPSNGLIYVTDRTTNNLSVVTPSSQTAAPGSNTGKTPEGIVFDLATGYLYVGNSGSNNVSVIDPATDLQVVALPVGAGPVALAYASGNGNVSVANGVQGTISLIGEPGAAVNTLVSVAITPNPDTVQTGTSATFTATPTCSLGTCPGGTTYTWSLTNGLATLTSPTGASVTFNAGSTAGIDALFVNATLSATTVQGGPDIVTLSTTPVPTLASVTVSPTSDSLQTGARATFTASVVCTGGTCPGGTTYSWTLTNSLGSITPTVGASETFTAGSTAGLDNLFVNATLNSVTVQSLATPVTITSAPLPVLSGVTISPPSDRLFVGTTDSFTAAITCTGGTCPAGATFSWTLTNVLGSLTLTSTASETFTAGATPGIDNLFVNATLNTVTVQSAPSVITLVYPQLTSVATDPTAATVYTGGTQTVTALLTCEFSLPCPAGATFSWTATNSLGTLTSATSVTSTFTAGSAAGVDNLFVNATLNSITVQSTPSVITIGLPTLSGVVVTPASASVATGGTQSFSAAISCTGGPCPNGVVYSWTLSSTLGSLGSSSGTPVTFTAGGSAGTLTIDVTATLNGNTATGSSPITITASGGGGGSGGAQPRLLGLPTDDAYGLFAALGLLVAGLVVFFAMGMKNRKEKEKLPPASKKEEKTEEEEEQEEEESELLEEAGKSPETSA